MVDELARRAGLAFEAERANAVSARLRDPQPVLLLKPLTFMNLSGEAVAAVRAYYRIELPDLLVVTDDVNLPLGRLRARREGSSGGHNGLKSVAQALGTEAFNRLRVGVGRGDGRRDLADHVLARFEPEEQEVIEAAILRAADAVELFVAEDIDAVMNRYNADPAGTGRKGLADTDDASIEDSQT